MVIDDSAALRQTVRDALVDAGYEVIGAADGQEALGMLDGSKIDLMICDVHMPRMDGLTFVREVKRLADYRFVPVIMLTTESSEKSRLAGLTAGAQAGGGQPLSPRPNPPALFEAPCPAPSRAQGGSMS